MAKNEVSPALGREYPATTVKERVCGAVAGTRTVFTIGHSNHSFEEFLSLLVRHGVDTLADVRSAPYSRFAPHFDHEALSGALGREGVKYQYYGRELGGRPKNPACYEAGRVQYDRVKQTESFRRGLKRLRDELVAGSVALMCAEKEPLYCHRTLLVAEALDEPPDEGEHVHVEHILANGGVERHRTTIDRLLAKYGLEEDGGLFPRSRKDRIADAIALHMKRIGRKPSTDSANYKRKDDT